MNQSYIKIRNDYLRKAWARSTQELLVCLPAELEGDVLIFQALGEKCILDRDQIKLSDQSADGPEGLLIALYASCVPNLPVQLQPLKSFKELPNSMPYHTAFAANAEHILIPLCAQDKTSAGKTPQALFWPHK